MVSKERKQEYFAKMVKLLENYNKAIIVGCNNVGSYQMQKIRVALRGQAEVLMGKNTLMLKVIKQFCVDNPGSQFTELVPLIVGNIGVIFTNDDVGLIRKIIEDNRVPAAAKTGALAECDVVVPPGPTGCDPGQTSWFQALNVPTKISRGQIEIVSEVFLIKKGEKVGASEAGLLQKLNIRPFTYGLVLKSIYDDGAVYDAKVLDITPDILKTKFKMATRKIAALSSQVGYPTLASMPHTLAGRVRDMIAIASMVEYSFSFTEPWDELFNMDPEELAAKLAAQAKAASGGDGAAAEAKEEVEEVEVDMSGGGDLFGGGDDAY